MNWFLQKHCWYSKNELLSDNISHTHWAHSIPLISWCFFNLSYICNKKNQKLNVLKQKSKYFASFNFTHTYYKKPQSVNWGKSQSAYIDLNVTFICQLISIKNTTAVTLTFNLIIWIKRNPIWWRWNFVLHPLSVQQKLVQLYLVQVSQ